MNKIGNDYLTLKKFPQAMEERIKVLMHTYALRTMEGYPDYNEVYIDNGKDISNIITDYSYDCDKSNDICQSASLTLHSEMSESEWYGVKRDDKSRDWITDKGQLQSLSVKNVIFHLIKIYINHDTGEEITWDLGFFKATNDSRNYSPTTGDITLNLTGITAMLSGEYGGNVMTGYHDPYNVPLSYTCEEYEKDKYAQKIVDENGKITKDWEQSEKTKLWTIEYEVSKQFPFTLSINEGVMLNWFLFYFTAMGSHAKKYDKLNDSVIFPINKCQVGNDGQKIAYIPYQIDFDATTSRMDMIKKILEITYIDGRFWVDENRCLQINGHLESISQTLMRWKDYGHLIVSVENTYDDANYYNITDVYGKDNKYHARYEWFGDPVGDYRVQILQFDELQSDKECMDRAKWETWKARHNHQTVNVTLVDMPIPQLSEPSNCLGKPIEYVDTEGEIGLYTLEKISVSSNNQITMTLSYYSSLYEKNDNAIVFSTPYICGHEIIGNYIRIYVDADDNKEKNAVGIEYGVVKLYLMKNGFGDFVGQSVQTIDRDGRTIKYIDYHINKSGTYEFCVELFNPHIGNSVWGGGKRGTGYYDHYTIEVTVDENGEYCSPYLTDELGNILTDENGNRIIL